MCTLANVNGCVKTEETHAWPYRVSTNLELKIRHRTIIAAAASIALPLWRSLLSDVLGLDVEAEDGRDGRLQSSITSRPSVPAGDPCPSIASNFVQADYCAPHLPRSSLAAVTEIWYWC